MADLNITYRAFKPQYDIRSIKDEVLYEFLPDNVRANVDTFLNKITDLDARQSTTEADIKIPYTGSTDEDRKAWIVKRIDAIYNRLDLIKADTEDNKKMIVDLGGKPPIDALNTIGALLSVIPATRPVGAVTTFISQLVNRSNNNEGYKQQKINEAAYRINNYAGDVTQLSPILKQLTTELAEAPNPKSLTYKAGTTNSQIGIYVLVGVGIILLLMVIRNNRMRR